MIDIDTLEALAKAATSGLPGDRIPFALHAMDPAAILALIAEVRELRADAERYRFLRDGQADTSDFCCASLEIYLPVPPRDKAEPPRKHSACFDAAIDAARAKEKA
jgi:hypothetical protein